MGSSRHPPPRTPDILPSLVGLFNRNESIMARGDAVENDNEGHEGIRLRDGFRPGEVVEISSGEEASHEDAGGNKRRKSCRRHTAEQIQVLEVAFKESPHPDEKQQQQLSEQLGLTASQVNLWFQNRRSQIKAIQKQHENTPLKPQLEKLEEENRALREFIKKSPYCPTATNIEEQVLRLENAKLKAEIEKLRTALGSNTAAGAAAFRTSPSCSTASIQIRSRSALDDYVGVGHDKMKLLELAGRAMDELTTMCSSGAPLWVRSVETGRDVLNYDEYARLFRQGDDFAVWSVEASRETGVLLCIEAMKLVRTFVDVNEWKELFPSMITKAATLEVVNDYGDGIVQLMFAKVQTLTPLVPAREFHFLRHCKQLGTGKWAIVDVSLDNFEQPGAQTSSTLRMCMKKPSGCIVEHQSCGYCKVTWVEHAKCRKAAVPLPLVCRAVTASGLAFGARRWVAALQLQCERMVFSVATNIPTRGFNGVDILAGRQSVLKLAQRMTSSLYRAIGASRDLAWSKASSNHGGARDIRVTSWKNNTGVPGEPQGLITCAVLSVWLPVSPAALFGFLLDESRRHEWDLIPPGKFFQSYVSVRKGDDHGNRVTAYVAKSSAEEMRGKWFIQDSSTSRYESTVVYAPVDAAALRRMIDGHDSSAVPVLPCGVVVMPDGLEAAKPAVITSRKGKEAEDSRRAVESAGSLVTMVFQAQASPSAAATDAVKYVTRLASVTLGNIKKALRIAESGM